MAIRIFASALFCACTATADEVQVFVNDLPRCVLVGNAEINAARLRVDDAKGEVSALDAAQAQVDGQRLLLEGRKLDMEARALAGELTPLLGMRASDTLVLTGDLPAVKVPAKSGRSARADHQPFIKSAPLAILMQERKTWPALSPRSANSKSSIQTTSSTCVVATDLWQYCFSHIKQAGLGSAVPRS